MLNSANRRPESPSWIRRSDRGVSLLVVQILLVVTVVLGLAGALLYARYDRTTVIQKELEARQRALVNGEGPLKLSLFNDLKDSGLIAAIDEVTELDPTRVDQALKERREKVLAPPKVDDEEAAKFYPRELPQRRDEAGLFGTLETLVVEQAAKLTLLQGRHKQLQLDLQLAKVGEEARRNMKPEVLQPKMDLKAELEARIKEKQGQIREQDEAYRRRKQELEEELNQLQTTLDTQKEEFNRWEMRENNRLGHLRQRLEELKKKEVIRYETLTPHGEILRPDAEQKRAFINRGSRHRVVAGMKFRVMRPGREGKLEPKADVEVKKVWQDTSEVAIVRTFEGAPPVIEGDLIVNPFFNRRRPVVVAFVGLTGDRSRKLAMTTNEAANRIREIGSEPRFSVDLDIDFVLFTETSDEKPARDNFDEYKRAVQLEVPIAEASEWYEYLMR